MRQLVVGQPDRRRGGARRRRRRASRRGSSRPGRSRSTPPGRRSGRPRPRCRRACGRTARGRAGRSSSGRTGSRVGAAGRATSRASRAPTPAAASRRSRSRRPARRRGRSAAGSRGARRGASSCRRPAPRPRRRSGRAPRCSSQSCAASSASSVPSAISSTIERGSGGIGRNAQRPWRARCRPPAEPRTWSGGQRAIAVRRHVGTIPPELRRHLRGRARRQEPADGADVRHAVSRAAGPDRDHAPRWARSALSSGTWRLRAHESVSRNGLGRSSRTCVSKPPTVSVRFGGRRRRNSPGCRASDRVGRRPGPVQSARKLDARTGGRPPSDAPDAASGSGDDARAGCFAVRARSIWRL